MRSWIRAGCLLGVLLLGGGASLIDEGEFHCEEAVNHLNDCCPGIGKIYHCTAGRGCDGTRPDLDDPLATQVRDQSCDELVGSGACITPPMSPKPPMPCESLFSFECNDLAAPRDLAVPRDLSQPRFDLSSVDGAEGDGP